LEACCAEEKFCGLHFQRIRAGADDDHGAVGAEAVDQGGHGFATWCGCQDDLSAAKFLKFAGGVGGGAVNVDVRAEFFGECFAVFATADGDDAVAKFAGKLHAEVAEAADALNGDQISGHSTAVAQRVEGGDAGAEKRGGFDGIKRIWHLGHGFRGGEHVLGVAAIVADAGNFLVSTMDEIAAAALEAGSVVPAVPPDTDALTLFPHRDAGADFVDDASDFVAGRTRIGDTREEAVFHKVFAEADTAGLNTDADLSCRRLGNFAFLQFEIGAGLGDHSDFHLGHFTSPRETFFEDFERHELDAREKLEDRWILSKGQGKRARIEEFVLEC
jgi:hypothetical protein